MGCHIALPVQMGQQRKHGGCWESGMTLCHPVPGERPPSSMVPSILISAAQGSKLVIGGAGGHLIIPAVAQVSVAASARAPLCGQPCGRARANVGC